MARYSLYRAKADNRIFYSVVYHAENKRTYWNSDLAMLPTLLLEGFYRQYKKKDKMINEKTTTCVLDFDHPAELEAYVFLRT